MFERYTDQAKRAIFFARLEAFHRKEMSISAADVLLGLTWEDGTRADRIAKLRVQSLRIRAGVLVPHLPITDRPYLEKGDIPLDSEAKKALAYAAIECDLDWEYWLDTDHLLRALARFQNDTASVLKSLNLDLPELREASRQDRKQFPPQRVSPALRIKRVAGRYLSLFVFLLFVLLFVLAIKLLNK